MSCVSAFCNILQHFIGEIFGIPENVPRFLENVFHIPDERQLGLVSLPSTQNQQGPSLKINLSAVAQLTL